MDFQFLSKTPLFAGIMPDELCSLMKCLKGNEKKYPKDSRIMHIGQMIDSLGLVISGRVSIENDDLWGNRTMLDVVETGQIFGETYACAGNVPMMVNVVALEDTTVLFLQTGSITGRCGEACAYHGTLIRNLLTITAQKNLGLSRRIFHTAHKTIRGRLLSYLSVQAQRNGAMSFKIPFNRQQLADYLSVDRSALSHEIGKMQQEGILISQKNNFTMLDGALADYT